MMKDGIIKIKNNELRQLEKGGSRRNRCCLKDITEFYYTRLLFTYLPNYQRYPFYEKNEKYLFYHEKHQ